MNKLPQEVFDMVINQLVALLTVADHRIQSPWRLSDYARLSRRWQHSIERFAFCDLDVSDREFSMLQQVLSMPRRIDYLRNLNYEILIPRTMTTMEMTVPEGPYLRHKLWTFLHFLSKLPKTLRFNLDIVMDHEKPRSQPAGKTWDSLQDTTTRKYTFTQEISELLKGRDVPFPKVLRFNGKFSLSATPVAERWNDANTLWTVFACFPHASRMKLDIINAFRDGNDGVSTARSDNNRAPPPLNMVSQLRNTGFTNLSELTIWFGNFGSSRANNMNPGADQDVYSRALSRRVNLALGKLSTQLRKLDIRGSFALTRHFFFGAGAGTGAGGGGTAEKEKNGNLNSHVWPRMELFYMSTGLSASFNSEKEEGSGSRVAQPSTSCISSSPSLSQYYDLHPRQPVHDEDGSFAEEARKCRVALRKERQRSLDGIFFAITHAMLNMPKIKELDIEFQFNSLFEENWYYGGDEEMDDYYYEPFPEPRRPSRRARAARETSQQQQKQKPVHRYVHPNPNGQNSARAGLDVIPKPYPNFEVSYRWATRHERQHIVRSSSRARWRPKLLGLLKRPDQRSWSPSPAVRNNWEKFLQMERAREDSDEGV